MTVEKFYSTAKKEGLTDFVITSSNPGKLRGREVLSIGLADFRVYSTDSGGSILVSTDNTYDNLESALDDLLKKCREHKKNKKEPVEV